eukprot:TRINITY_DN54682_c0_g1_i2.p1 TRINITY_DN54682_c0_g1~~TRINITY_DN54682_c0_g1_i2.p1  ORF type:complete len:670 (+),score=73.10 TRINITY_DN54682_c0_g1_i2:27-2012(+)
MTDPLATTVGLPSALDEFTDIAVGITRAQHVIPVSKELFVVVLCGGGETPTWNKLALFNTANKSIDTAETTGLPADAKISGIWQGWTSGSLIAHSGDALWVLNVTNKSIAATQLLTLPDTVGEVQVTSNSVVTLQDRKAEAAGPAIYPFTKEAQEPFVVSVWTPQNGWRDVCNATRGSENLVASRDGTKAAWKVYTNMYAPEEGERGEWFGCGLTSGSTDAVQLTQGAGRVDVASFSFCGDYFLYNANYRDRLDNQCITTHLDLYLLQWKGSEKPAEKPARITTANKHFQTFGFLTNTNNNTFDIWTTPIHGMIQTGEILTVSVASATETKITNTRPMEAPVYASMAFDPSLSVCGYGTDTDATLPRLITFSTAEAQTINSVEVEQPHLNRFADWKMNFVKWTSGDGKEIQGMVYDGPNSDKRDKPLLVHVHGGPAVCMVALKRDCMDCTRYPYRHFLNAGYRVFQPLYRGGMGFGDEFSQANIKKQGLTEPGGDLNDILTGVDHVLKEFGGSAEKVGVFGGSYGGYMTIRALAVTNRFAAGVALYGFVHNRFMSLEGGDFTWENEYLGPHTTWPLPEESQVSDCFNHLGNIKSPMLLMHGAQDDICTPSQSFITYRCLHDRGVPTGLIMYPGEGHGFKKPEHRQDRDRRSLAWFLRYLAP